MCRPGCSFEGFRTFARPSRKRIIYSQREPSVCKRLQGGGRGGLFVQANEQIPLQGAAFAPRDGARREEAGAEGRQRLARSDPQKVAAKSLFAEAETRA